MAESFLSPGVFTNENDQSFVAQGISQIGASFVGPTLKGPAFVPTQVSSFNDFTTKFGQESPTTYIPYGVRNYLRSSGVATVTRVLGNGGWLFDGFAKKIAAVVSGSTLLTVLHPTLNANSSVAELSSTIGTGSFASFNLTISGSSVFKQTSASLDYTSPTYITRVLGNSPSSLTGSAYPYINFRSYFSASVSSGTSSLAQNVKIIVNDTPCTFTSSYQGGYQEAITPWIISQTGVRLFRFHHRGDGFAGNTDVKLAISNIAPSTINGIFSTFSIIIRDFNDTDNVPSVKESFNGLTLNSDDAGTFIGQGIGDQYSRYDSIQNKVIAHGEYVNSSDYVYLEMSDAVKNGGLDSTLYPAGFEGLYETICGFTGYSLPSASMIQSNTGSVVYSGFDFSNPDNMNYLNPIPKEATHGNNTSFFLNANGNKFIVPFQGGTDGMNYATIKNIGKNITATNVFGFDLSTSTSAGSLSYIQALNILANTEQFDFNLLVMPGIINTLHPSVVQYGLSTVQTRTDAVYILDLCGSTDTIATAVQSAASIDSSYGATYYPWVKIIDSSNNKQVSVPPSVVVPQVFSYNDKVGQEWFAPAGLNRGGIGGVISVVNKLSKPERDILYPARINPIASFPDTGIAVWGNKTLQFANTALTRISVRRLLINLRKFTASAAKYLIFEGNTTQTRTQFLNAVRPYYSYVQSKQGVYSITVVMDETNNTASVIDQNELVGAIYVQPVKDAEFIKLDFNINPTGTII